MVQRYAGFVQISLSDAPNVTSSFNAPTSLTRRMT
jgi:hypothetical protein